MLQYFAQMRNILLNVRFIPGRCQFFRNFEFANCRGILGTLGICTLCSLNRFQPRPPLQKNCREYSSAAKLRTLSLAATLLLAVVWAQAAEFVAASPPASPEEANVLRDRAEAIRAAAEARHADEQKVCRSKFLVNDCLEAARKVFIEQSLEARALEKEVRDFEREAHRREVEAKEEKRLREAPEREAAQQAQAEAFRVEEARKAEERQRKLADKERRAVEERTKSAEKEAARREKLEKRARKDAERAAKRRVEAPAGQ